MRSRFHARLLILKMERFTAEEAAAMLVSADGEESEDSEVDEDPSFPLPSVQHYHEQDEIDGNADEPSNYTSPSLDNLAAHAPSPSLTNPPAAITSSPAPTNTLAHASSSSPTNTPNNTSSK